MNDRLFYFPMWIHFGSFFALMYGISTTVSIDFSTLHVKKCCKSATDKTNNASNQDVYRQNFFWGNTYYYKASARLYWESQFCLKSKRLNHKIEKLHLRRGHYVIIHQKYLVFLFCEWVIVRAVSVRLATDTILALNSTLFNVWSIIAAYSKQWKFFVQI